MFVVFFDRCMEIHELRFGDCYVSCLVFSMWRLPLFEKIGPYIHLNKKRLTMGVLSLLKCHIFFQVDALRIPMLIFSAFLSNFSFAFLVSYPMIDSLVFFFKYIIFNSKDISAGLWEASTIVRHQHH